MWGSKNRQPPQSLQAKPCIESLTTKKLLNLESKLSPPKCFSRSCKPLAIQVSTLQSKNPFIKVIKGFF